MERTQIVIPAEEQLILEPVGSSPKMHRVGFIDVELYCCITEHITTNEVIITDERIEHIRDHHPDDFEIIEPFLQDALSNPDYILADKVNTGLILKEVQANGIRLQIVLRICTSADPAGYKNSIISAWRIRKKEYNRLIRNKIILYKR